MLRGLVCCGVFAGCLVAGSKTLLAQEVIHALTGTVSVIDSKAKTFTVFQDNGTQGEFKYASKTPGSFDKRVAAGTTTADAFNTQGAYAIVFYFENSDGRTGVALKSLGAGPFTSTQGTVEKCDRGHFISVRDGEGTLQTFRIHGGTVAETNFGVVDGSKFSAEKGDRVRVVSAIVEGTPTALFVRDI
jgi:hypothetical protein